MDKQWYLATRRLWVGVVIRTIVATVVVWPMVSAIALLISHFGFGPESNAFFYIAIPLSLVVNLLALLWAIRQALQRPYPQGSFRLVCNEESAP